jgi:hypothetical protein
MKEIFDLSKRNWISENLLPQFPNNEWKFGHVIPQGFDAYCKILPTIYEDLDITDEARTWNDVKFNDNDIEFQYLAARDVVYKLNFRGQRIRLEQLAIKNKIPFTHKVLDSLYHRQWPIRLVKASEGEMDAETAHHLSRVFAQIEIGDKYYFSYYGWEKLRILEGNLSEGLITIESGKLVPGDSLYWWDTDKRWCVAVDYDSEFSLCGASFDVINALLNDPELECFSIDINEKYS